MQNSKKTLDIFPPAWVVLCVFLVGIFWLLLTLKELVVLLVVGYCLAYAVDPGVTFLQNKKFSRSTGFFVVFGTLLILIAIVAYTALPTLIREFERLSDNFSNYFELARQRAEPLLRSLSSSFLEKFRNTSNSLTLEHKVPEMGNLPSVAGDALNKILQGTGAALISGYSITLTIANLLLLPFIAFYLSVDFPNLHQKALELIPPQFQSPVKRIFSEIDRYVSAYARGQVLVCSVLFMLYAIGLKIVGVELWLLLAFIAGFGNMIPYFGFISGIVLSSVMALVTFGDISHLIQVWVVFAFVQFLEGMFITPKIVGDKVGLSPLIIILALFAGAQLFGILGLFLAVPAAAVAKVLLREFHAWMIARTQLKTQEDKFVEVISNEISSS